MKLHKNLLFQEFSVQNEAKSAIMDFGRSQGAMDGDFFLCILRV